MKISSLFVITYTLNEYSSLTRKGNDIAANILFSFNVCSTCFNFTTCGIELPLIITVYLKIEWYS